MNQAACEDQRYVARLRPFSGEISAETWLGDVGIWDTGTKRFVKRRKSDGKWIPEEWRDE